MFNLSIAPCSLPGLWLESQQRALERLSKASAEYQRATLFSQMGTQGSLNEKYPPWAIMLKHSDSCWWLYLGDLLEVQPYWRTLDVGEEL